MNIELPYGDQKESLDFPHFPARQHTFIWRNWGIAPVRKIASVLATSEENVAELAEAMGLDARPEVPDQWLERGYITIIRNNWHLLPYEQLLELLGWTPEKLAYALKEDDFLWVKLGYVKPLAEKLAWKPLTGLEKQRIQEIKNLVEEHFKSPDIVTTEKPFDFLKGFKQVKKSMYMDVPLEDEDSIRLDDKWYIEAEGFSDRVRMFAEWFAGNYEREWGLRLLLQRGQQNKKAILLKIEKNPGLLAESYKIDVGENGINVVSVDEVGLLRGLQRIYKQTCANGGPFLKKGTTEYDTVFDLRMIYSYFGVYGDPFLDSELDPYPDWYLERLSKLGVNAVWMQGILYRLIPFRFDPELSEGWQKRLKGLRKLACRAADYGIGLYLYLNEPRSMPHKFFERYPHLKGSGEGDFSALCTSQPEVREYLCEGIKQLFTEVPELAGIFTITMSENLTNCYSRADPSQGELKCPRCSKRLPQDVVAEVNRLMYEAAVSVKADARVICWTWAWRPEWAEQAIALLPEGVEIMCNSEEAMPTSIRGVKGQVADYSMSIVGPGEKSTAYWNAARNHNIKTIAKVQLNNTWECSAVPYLPVTDLVKEHLENLKNAGVNGLMLSWTLGGYPSLNLELASDFYWDVKREENAAQDGKYPVLSSCGTDRYLKEAFSIFSKAFKEFPFNINVLYNAPQNYGPMNLLFERPTGYRAAMTGFPYDDIEGWRGIYTEDILEDQFKRLSIGWKAGLDILEKATGKDSTGDVAYDDIWNISLAPYCHFRSTYLQIAFVRLRNRFEAIVDETERHTIAGQILKILDEEIDLAKKLYELVSRDSRIGFEASNHYFYTKQNLMEKVLNCDYLKNKY